MTILTRSVRMNIDLQADPIEPSINGYAGSPSMHAWGAFVELRAAIRGDIDNRIGYLLDIKSIDRAVRATIQPLLTQAMRRGEPSPARVLLDGMRPLNDALAGALSHARLVLSPFLSLEATMSDPTSVLLRQRFDFAASHRLNVPTLSHEENQRLFGKCNNPHGHGHNYQFEPCARVYFDAQGRPSLTLAQLEAAADQAILRRFDHKHLNLDTDEFRDGSGLNPSVENIAKVFFELLSPRLKSPSGGGSDLVSITVWETDRTSATYPG